MIKRTNLFKQLLVSKIRSRNQKEPLRPKIRSRNQKESLRSKIKYIYRQRVLRSTVMLLFLVVLCTFSMAAEPLPREAADAVSGNHPVRSTDAVNPENSCSSEKAGAADPTEENMPVYLSSGGEPEILRSEEESGAVFSRTEREAAQWDKDSLLSIVSSIPGNEELFCSRRDILASPQAAKVRSIIGRLDEDGFHVGFIVLDLNSGDFFSLNPDLRFYSASTIKGPYVAALNKFSPEIADEYTKSMMENTIQWSSNEDFENLHYLYGNDAMYDMTAYTDVSDSIIDEYNWYPYLTAKDLTRLWIGMYLYFFEDTNENSEWCRSLYTDSAESFIGSALGEDYTVYTKPGWYSDWEDISRSDAGIVMADEHGYILTVLSDAFPSYDDLEELAAALDEVHGLLCSPGTAG